MRPRAADWEMWTWMRANQLGEFSQKIMEKELFEFFSMQTKSFEKNVFKTFVIFRLEEKTKIGIFAASRLLARLIQNQDSPVYWKEGGMGYRIDAQGKIFGKWKLDAQ